MKVLKIFHTMTGYFLNSLLLFNLLLNMVSKGTKGTLVLELQGVDSTAYTNIPCNDTFTFTETSGRVDIRRPTSHEEAFSDCYCLLYPHNGEKWPIQGTISLQYLEGNNWIFWKDYNYNYFKIGYSGSYSYAIQFEYHETNSYHTLQIIYNTMEEFRYMTMMRIFAFFPENIRLDISCSPWSYADARTGTPRTSTNPSAAGATATVTRVSPTRHSTASQTYSETTRTNSPLNSGEKKSNTTYIIIGTVITAAVVLIIVVFAVVYFYRKSGLQRLRHKNTGPEFPSQETDSAYQIQDNAEKTETVAYVNIASPSNEAPDTEYAQVDIAHLAKKPELVHNQENMATNKNDQILTYADLDFNTITTVAEDTDGGEKRSDAEKDVSELYTSPMKIWTKEEPTTCDGDASELYAKPKEGTSNQEIELAEASVAEVTASEAEKDISEMYAKPKKHIKPNIPTKSKHV